MTRSRHLSHYACICDTTGRAGPNMACVCEALVVGVARLGDRDLRGWWGCSAMDAEIGQFILANTFPRTARIVGAELAVLSAARRHHDLLARPNAVHLFSDTLGLVQQTRTWLAQQKLGTNSTDPLISELEAWTDPDTAAAHLARWADRPINSGDPNLGRVTTADINDPYQRTQLARALAACYSAMTEMAAPPYFNLATPNKPRTELGHDAWGNVL